MLWLLRFQWLRSAVSALTVFLSLLLAERCSAWAIATPVSLLVCFIAVFISAWYGSMGAGLLATGTATLFYLYYFLEPVEFLANTANNAVVLGLFGVGGTLTKLTVWQASGHQSAPRRA